MFVDTCQWQGLLLAAK